MGDKQQDTAIPSTNDAVDQTKPNKDPDNSPPSYEDSAYPTTSQENDSSEVQPLIDTTVDVALPPKLPSYEVATDLPTYETFTREKEDEVRQELMDIYFGNASTFDNDEIYVDGVAVGSDCVFFFAFIMAFFFNWLGFFLGYCMMMNLAGRYGATSGFGLSLANWLLFVKYSNEGGQWDANHEGMTTERHLMWWILFCLAVLLTLKGIINWARARKLLQLSPEQRQNGRVVLLY